MCGICGIIAPPGSRIDAGLLDRMTDLMQHRGPDERGVWINPSRDAGFGARRLSIIGIENGSQPILSEDGKCVLVANAEIYNYRELKRDLEARGHRFSTDTDIEVVLHLYEEMGPDFPGMLNGMFAFAIWDEGRRSLLLGRDRLGIKPLFYAQREGGLAFASEAKSIICAPTFSRAINPQAMHDYFSFDYIPGEQTIFEGISKVAPGSVLVLENQTCRSSRYWDLEFRPDTKVKSISFYSERVRELLAASVRRRLMSEVPLGVLLSGGMDSSAITALMARESAERISTFSIGFEEASFDERDRARIVARECNTDHHELLLRPGDVLNVLDTQIRHFDEPYADGAAIPTYFVCKMAGETVRVVLSGEGGDEIFAGYDTYAAFNLARYLHRMPSFLRKRILKPLIDLLPVSDKKVSFDFRAKRFIRGLSMPVPESHLLWRIVLTEAEKLRLYSSEFLQRVKIETSGRIFRDIFDMCDASDALNRLLYIDSKVFLPDDLFVKNDRMSMAHSVEARVPMTDPDLVEFMATVPVELKIRGLRRKYLLREAMRGILPSILIQKKKIGLDMPYSKWLKNELFDFMKDTLNSRKFRESGLFDHIYIESLIAEHVSRRRNNGRALWGLLNFALWYEAYM
ncbi:MAG: asparagine synthase (glutamine-hydrolyzing) [Candidatus Coatesbacteria bacterium]|nr:asparagine synthase (glutamine-hydrolyzing) [Candidatus Coatesbacteria bacterium]